MNKTVELKLDDPNLLIKRYKIRLTGARGTSLETTIPKEVFEREAKKLGLTVEEAVKELNAVWRYDGFDGLHLRFEPVEDNR